MKFLRTLALATALMAVLASPLIGQASVGLSVFGGGFIPNGDVPLPGQAEIDLSQDAGLIVGGRLNVQFLRLGIEAEAGYAFASVDPIVAEQRDFPDATTIFLGSVNLVFIIYQAPLSPLSIYVSAGGGLVNRGGDYFELFEDTTNPAAAVGLGIRFGLGPMAKIRVDIRDYVSSFAPTTLGGIEKPSQLQNDLIATVGLEVSLSPAP